MNRFFVLLLCALGLAFNACEKHPASELDGAHGLAAPHAAGHEAPGTHGAGHKAAPGGEAAHGKAPKYFPDAKH